MHAATVAMEYGIPAVPGPAKATRIVADGDLIEVNGNAGKVRRVE